MGLKFTNQFTVPLPIEQAWRVLLDVPTVARCLPGATLTKAIDDRTFEGTVDVRLGPVALSFGGTAKIVEADEANRLIRMNGSGNEKRARGQASAAFDIRLQEISDQQTIIVVESDVNLAGAVAQYGRGAGMMKAVADEIIGRFASNLAAAIAERKETTAPPPAAPSLSLVGIIWSALWRRLSRFWTGPRAQ